MNYLIQCDTVNGCGNVYPGDITACPKCGTSCAFSAPAAINPTHYAYDIEAFPNVWTCWVTHLATDTRWYFEISDRVNQLVEFVNFMHSLRACGAKMVGFNNLNYDYPVIHYMMQNSWLTAADIYVKSMSIINAPFGDRSHIVWDSDMVVPQIDLFKIWHFDNKNRRTSLKALEIAMRMPRVEDLPFPVGTVLTPSQIDVLADYNWHDVLATAYFYARSITAITLRENLSVSLGLRLTNDSDVKMGEKILVAEMEKSGLQCYERVAGRRSPRRTIRPHIALADAIYPYVKFERPEFDMVRGWIASQVITETKEVFNDIDVTREMIAYMDPELVKVHRPYVEKASHRKMKLSKIDPGTDLSQATFTADKLHCVIDGLTYIFGTGGIHASVESQIIHSDDHRVIIDVDVASFYPNLGIKNRMFPAHLGEHFCIAYHGVYCTRKGYRKDQPENGAFKLALNGAYGGSKNEHSPFYDPLYTMKTTINGQLLLCMLAEQLLKVPGLKMIQANTDGITFYTPRSYLDHCRTVCKWWEQVTLLELEEVEYSRMFIRDVNNYVAEKAENGKVKRIGAYAHERQDVNPATRESTYNKDPSALIVPMAAEQALVKGVDVAEFIRAHRDPYDFMIRAKVRRVDELVMRWPEYPGYEQEQQKTGRYYVTTAGGVLIVKNPAKGRPGTWKRKNGISDTLYMAVMSEIVSEMVPEGTPVDADGTRHDERIHTKNRSVYEPTETGLTVGWRVMMCNNVEDFDWSQVNYDYYIAEARKLVDPLTGSSN